MLSENQNPMSRVALYIDGFNLYYGLRASSRRRFLWLDFRALGERFLKPGQRLVQVKYFTARITGPEDKRLRQTTFLEAIEALGGVEILYGHLQANSSRCHQCGVTTPKEKETDVRIAVELLCDAVEDRFDVAILISGDSDLTPPIRALARMTPEKRIVVAFPPKRISVELEKAAPHFVIGRSVLKSCQMPDTITRADGFLLRRPETWK